MKINYIWSFRRWLRFFPFIISSVAGVLIFSSRFRTLALVAAVRASPRVFPFFHFLFLRSFIKTNFKKTVKLYFVMNFVLLLYVFENLLRILAHKLKT